MFLCDFERVGSSAGLAVAYPSRGAKPNNTAGQYYAEGSEHFGVAFVKDGALVTIGCHSAEWALSVAKINEVEVLYASVGRMCLSSGKHIRLLLFAERESAYASRIAEKTAL